MNAIAPLAAGSAAMFSSAIESSQAISAMSAAGAASIDDGNAGASSYRNIQDFGLKDKTVFIRCDFNCPVEDGIVADDWRIQTTIPTIRYALTHGAKVVLASHRGRPKGQTLPEFSMKPIAKRLFEHLQSFPVFVAHDVVGENAAESVRDLKPEQVLLLENLRFHPGETANDPEFAKQLASFADIYIDDAFGTAHRKHASTYGMVEHFSPHMRGIGLLMQHELNVLSEMMANPKHPFVAILGGAKISDKLGVVKTLMNICDVILIGGGMAFTFLKASGTEIGGSLVEEGMLGEAKEIIAMAKETGTKLYLPTDHVMIPTPVVVDHKANIPQDVISRGPKIRGNRKALDIGPSTISTFSNIALGNLNVMAPKTIFWNGPMGFFENEAFMNGTMHIAQAVAASVAYSVIGGGDSVRAIKASEAVRFIDHVSTGGGAMLNFISGTALPALEILRSKPVPPGAYF